RLVVWASASLLSSNTGSCRSLKIVSTGLSSGLALGKLTQRRRNCRMTRLVSRDVHGRARSWSKATHTCSVGYHRPRAARAGARTNAHPLVGEERARTPPETHRHRRRVPPSLSGTDLHH